MKKPIFENKEEFINFLENICHHKSVYNQSIESVEYLIHSHHSANLAKQYGYIKQSEFKEAQSKWVDLVNDNNRSLRTTNYIIDVADTYIRYLELDRLKNTEGK